MRRFGPITVAAAAITAAFALAGGPAHAGGVRAGYTPVVTNPWFPLVAGTRYTYVGVKDGKPSRDVVTVTHATRTIDGARCVSVSDRLYLRGKLEERTTDWYSQDAAGNVSYFGEDTAELDAAGHVTSTDGTWLAGVNGAQPGIYMPARPTVGVSGRQEFLRGQAEDHFKVIGRFSTLVGGHAAEAVLTAEWTPLEPGVLDHKLYVRGIGTVLEHTERGGDEHAELVSVTRG